MGYGDELMAAGQAREAFERDPTRRVLICGGDGKPRWHELWEGLDFIARPGEMNSGLPLQRIVNGPGARPYHKRPFTAAGGWQWTGWRVRDNRPVLAIPADILAAGKDFDGRPFVMLAPDAKAIYPNKDWGYDRFQAVVELLPRIGWIQCGDYGGNGIPWLSGVTKVRTKSFMEACGLLSRAALFVGNQGGLVHAAAALRVRSVVIFGGAEPPELMGYAENRNLTGGKPEEICGRILPCEHCKRAMAEITPEMVAGAIRTALDERAARKTEAA